MTDTSPSIPSPPPAGALPYKLLSAPLEVNRYVDRLQRVVTGYEVRLQWVKNGSVFSVFVPETDPLADTVDRLARAKGAELDTLHALAGE